MYSEKGVRPVRKISKFLGSKIFYVNKNLKIVRFIASLNNINDR